MAHTKTSSASVASTANWPAIGPMAGPWLAQHASSLHHGLANNLQRQARLRNCFFIRAALMNCLEDSRFQSSASFLATFFRTLSPELRESLILSLHSPRLRDMVTQYYLLDRDICQIATTSGCEPHLVQRELRKFQLIAAQTILTLGSRQ